MAHPVCARPSDSWLGPSASTAGVVIRDYKKRVRTAVREIRGTQESGSLRVWSKVYRFAGSGRFAESITNSDYGSSGNRKRHASRKGVVKNVVIRRNLRGRYRST